MPVRPVPRVVWRFSLAFAARALANKGMRELPHTHGCFVCGESNPRGLNLRFHTDGTTIHARFVPGSEHVGFQQTVHGGITATVLDEIMVWACAVRTGKFSYCAEMKVRYVSPVRPGEETIATAELVANRRQRLFEAKGELRSLTGQLLATATGKYVPVPNTNIESMLGEIVGDTSFLAVAAAAAAAAETGKEE